MPWGVKLLGQRQRHTSAQTLQSPKVEWPEVLGRLCAGPHAETEVRHAFQVKFQPTMYSQSDTRFLPKSAERRGCVSVSGRTREYRVAKVALATFFLLCQLKRFDYPPLRSIIV